ncbi:alpha/beta fold hydrolase [Umezawaea tangerina]|uniref:Pimeloyl-ACP methyl ester carboxylesterase n=1 Tax=Umezawaea tangerina TaxID=84725 RepID=A0A2T0SQC2_9PSEU|nr:alpha/beta hydrolase [Umezawaea tangerina]PRY35612.1 pimeloyl-ACP methyl ester carboxylesterase [Umezawaea tangerina]
MSKKSRPGSRSRALVAATAVVVTLLTGAVGAGAAPATTAQRARPTVILVHGALTDASVWRHEVEALQRKGYAVLAPAMPLRGLASDSAYLAAFLKTVSGPIVLAGHSYAGAVITRAAEGDPRVRALVYVTAFQPDTGETAGELNARFPGSRLGPDTTVVLEHPGGSELYLRQQDFRDVYAGDLSPSTAALMAATQRPVETAALGEPLQGRPAWRDTPSWALVATKDNSLPVATQRFMTARAHSRTTEVASSHAAPVSHPAEVTGLLLDAIRGTAY